MQVGYKVDECDYKDCPYRTEPMTNADRIRAMSDEELVRMLTLGEGAFDCFKCRNVVDGECDTNCPERCLDWLQQQAKGE